MYVPLYDFVYDTAIHHDIVYAMDCVLKIRHDFEVKIFIFKSIITRIVKKYIPSTYYNTLGNNIIIYYI